MRRWSSLTVAVTVALTLTLLVAGCSTYADDVARYEKLQDGTRVAVVASLATGASPAERQAYVGFDDLEPGDLVMVREIGRSWDEPQWRPTMQVVSRVPNE
jgi:hypothetical protein